jgi:hypothetical protein
MKRSHFSSCGPVTKRLAMGNGVRMFVYRQIMSLRWEGLTLMTPRIQSFSSSLASCLAVNPTSPSMVEVELTSAWHGHPLLSSLLYFAQSRFARKYLTISHTSTRLSLYSPYVLLLLTKQIFPTQSYVAILNQVRFALFKFGLIPSFTIKGPSLFSSPPSDIV